MAYSSVPDTRTGSVLGRVRSGGPSVVPRWVLPVVAAVVVALVAAAVAGVFFLTQGPSGSPTPPAGQTTSGPTTATGSPSTSASTTTSAPVPAMVAVPAYFVGPVETGDGVRWALYREFFRVRVDDPASEASKAGAALRRAMDTEALANVAGYLQPWSGTTVEDVTVTPELITITLSGPGPDGFTAEQERLAVQELVWTVQAAVGRGTIPVTFRIADGSDALFGRFPASDRYTRPAPENWLDDLAPIWITSPSRDQVLSSTSDVVVEGQASVFEGTVSWALLRGTRTVRTGSAMATAGAPERGTYTIPLGRLGQGDYRIRVWEASAKDGTPLATVEMPFSVR